MSKTVEMTDEDIKALSDARDMLSDLGIEAAKRVILHELNPEEIKDMIQIMQEIERVGNVLTKFIGDGEEMASEVFMLKNFLGLGVDEKLN